MNRLIAASERYRYVLTGMFFGISFPYLIIVAAQIAGYINSTPPETVARFNAAVKDVKPQADLAIAAMKIARTELEARLAIDSTSHSTPKLQALRDVYPEIANDLDLILPEGDYSVLHVVGSDYKLLVYSPELCTAVAMSNPEMIDPRRTLKILGGWRYSVFCQYFGYWTWNARMY